MNHLYILIELKKLIPIIAKYCNEIKIGLLSGGKFKKQDVIEFTEWLKTIDIHIILKQSIKKIFMKTKISVFTPK